MLGGGLQYVDNVSDIDVWNVDLWRSWLSEQGSTVASLGLFVQAAAAIAGLLGLVVIGMATGVVRTVLRDWGFTLTRSARGFRRQRGLLTRTDVVMPAHRVQGLVIGTGLLRYRFGWHGLNFVSLAQDSEGESHVVAPFAQMDELAPIVTAAGFRLPDERRADHLPADEIDAQIEPLEKNQRPACRDQYAADNEEGHAPLQEADVRVVGDKLEEFHAPGSRSDIDVGGAGPAKPACNPHAGKGHRGEHRSDDAETLSVMKRMYQDHGMFVDPHTAVGIASAEHCAEPGVPTITLATAHPAKFPDAVKRATGVHPALPVHVADLFDREERIVNLPNDLQAIEAFVASCH